MGAVLRLERGGFPIIIRNIFSQLFILYMVINGLF